MTAAVIRAHSAKLCRVEFAYSESAKDKLKALAGVEFDGQQWTAPVMHLPEMKGIFTKLTVEPAVIEAYYALLQRMVQDLKGHERKKEVKALLSKHAVGITAMQAKSAQMALMLR